LRPSCDCLPFLTYFFFSSRRRHTRSKRDWSSDVCSSDLLEPRCEAFNLIRDQPCDFTGSRFLIAVRYMRIGPHHGFTRRITGGSGGVCSMLLADHHKRIARKASGCDVCFSPDQLLTATHHVDGSGPGDCWIGPRNRAVEQKIDFISGCAVLPAPQPSTGGACKLRPCFIGGAGDAQDLCGREIQNDGVCSRKFSQVGHFMVQMHTSAVGVQYREQGFHQLPCATADHRPTATHTQSPKEHAEGSGE